MTDLPQPPNWRNRWGLLILGIAIFVAGTATALVQSVAAVQQDHYLTAAITGGFGVFMLGALLALGVGRVRAGTLRGESDSTGTTLRGDPLVGYFLCLSFIGAAVSSGLYLFAPHGNETILFSAAGRDLVNQFYMSCLFILSLIALPVMFRRHRSIYFRLAADEVEYSDTTRPVTTSWDDVTDVTDEELKRPSHRPISILVKNDKPILIRNAGGFVPNAPALYWMVRHYWEHPEDRAELTDGRALERLRNQQFDPE